MKTTPLGLFVWSMIVGFLSIGGVAMGAIILIVKDLADLVFYLIVFGFGGLVIAWFLIIIAWLSQNINMLKEGDRKNV